MWVRKNKWLASSILPLHLSSATHLLWEPRCSVSHWWGWRDSIHRWLVVCCKDQVNWCRWHFHALWICPVYQHTLKTIRNNTNAQETLHSQDQDRKQTKSLADCWRHGTSVKSICCFSWGPKFTEVTQKQLTTICNYSSRGSGVLLDSG